MIIVYINERNLKNEKNTVCMLGKYLQIHYGGRLITVLLGKK